MGRQQSSVPWVHSPGARDPRPVASGVCSALQGQRGVTGVVQTGPSQVFSHRAAAGPAPECHLPRGPAAWAAEGAAEGCHKTPEGHRCHSRVTALWGRGVRLCPSPAWLPHVLSSAHPPQLSPGCGISSPQPVRAPMGGKGQRNKVIYIMYLPAELLMAGAFVLQWLPGCDGQEAAVSLCSTALFSNLDPS